MSAAAATAAPPGPRPAPLPGDVLLHAGPLLAALAIALNDYVLRPRAPGWLSGKLSDAGLCYLLPFLVLAALEWGGQLAAWVGQRAFRPLGPVAVTTSTLLAAAYFIGQELVPPFGRFHVALVERLLSGRHVVLTRDPSDLGCLVFTALAFLELRRLRSHG